MNNSHWVRDIKNNTSNFINDQKFLKKKLSCQGGYGAFSFAHAQIEHVYQYIANQEIHYRAYTYKVEYIDFL